MDRSDHELHPPSPRLKTNMRTRAFPSLLAVLALAACHKSPPAHDARDQAAIAVKTTRAAAEVIPAFVEVPAVVRPALRADISSQITGAIVEIALLGQKASAGDPLVRLSSPDADARLGLARAQFAEAERAVARETDLVERRVSPPEALRAATDALRIARAGVTAAEALVAHTRIAAPFAGRVTTQFKLSGDLATPGASLLVMESTQDLRAEGSLPEEFSASFAVGTELGVQLDRRAPPVTGRIEEIASADPLTHTRFAKLSFSTPEAFSGQFARLLIPSASDTAIVVPASAVTSFGQMERIFVVVGQHAVLRLVKVGRTIGERVEILSGLSAGESVILNPPAALRDGSPVATEP